MVTSVRMQLVYSFFRIVKAPATEFDKFVIDYDNSQYKSIKEQVSQFPETGKTRKNSNNHGNRGNLID
jgi:hypothetical protein